MSVQAQNPAQLQPGAQQLPAHDITLRGRLAALPEKKWPVGGVLLLIILVAFWRLSGSHDGREANSRRSAAAPGRVATVSRHDMPVVEHTLGKVVANSTVQITSRVQGILDAAKFKEGQFVKKGDLLFQIDARGYNAALEQARAILLRDQAQLKNAMRDKQRYEALRTTGNVSLQQLDTATTNAEMLTATVAADKAAVELADLNVSYTQIRSPVDGKTGPVLIQPGNMIANNSTAPLVMIAQMQPIKIAFTLPQSDLARIQMRQRAKGLKASLDVKDAKGAELTAPVDFTDNAVSTQSGTIELRSTFDNGDLSLVPGQLVNVTVELNNIENALIVPRDAINDGPDGTYVYVVTDNKAVTHNIKVLFDDTQNVAVQGDLQPGDKVVTEGQLRVLPGGAVNVMQPRDGTGGARNEGGADQNAVVAPELKQSAKQKRASVDQAT